VEILCLIDTLDSGGAQRQLAILAKLLSDSGHDVTVLSYHRGDFYLPYLQENGVKVVILSEPSKLWRYLRVLAKLIFSRRDIIIAYLQGPSKFAEISSFFNRAKIISSERSYGGNPESRGERFRYWLHGRADVLVTNSEAQLQWIQHHYPHLKGESVSIFNCVDLEHFSPDKWSRKDGPSKIAGVGRVDKGKSPLLLLEAVYQLRDPSLIHIDWYGRVGEPKYAAKLKSRILELGASDSFILHGPTDSIRGVYRASDFICQPTRLEGCSNVVCEAIACGKIVITTPAGDNERLVENGVNGFIFPIGDLEALVVNLSKAIGLSSSQRQSMEKASRNKAVGLLSQQTFLESYESLIVK